MEEGIKSPHKVSYDEAWLYCMTLNHNGHKDWRLPTEYETGAIRSLMIWCNDDRFKDTRQQYVAVPVRTV